MKKFDDELLGKSGICFVLRRSKEVLESGPDRNGKTKLEQPEMLQEFHDEYETCTPKKCLLNQLQSLEKITLISSTHTILRFKPNLQ